MKLIVAEQNYWPGYLDALTNVLLNLLMLVAVFAMGLVSLNLQAFKQQQQMSQLGAQWAQVVREMLGDENPASGEPEAEGKKGKAHDSASLSARLNALNIQEILVRREELAKKTQLMLKAREDERQQQAQAQLAQVAALLASQEKLLEEKQKKMAEEEMRLRELQEKIKQERQQIAQFQAKTPAQGVPVMVLRIPGRVNSAPARDSGSTLPNALGAQGINYQLAWEYSPDEFSWSSASRPKGYSETDKSKKWALRIYADMDNARSLREAFARAASIREVLVRDGYVREFIKVDIKPAQALSGPGEIVYRTVFLLPQQ